METDARISKLARNLSRVESEEEFSQTCKQILELLEVDENRRYVSRSFNCLNVAFEAAFRALSDVKWPTGSASYAELLAKIANDADPQGLKLFPWMMLLLEPTSDRSADFLSMVKDVLLKMVPMLSPKAGKGLLGEINAVMVKEKFQSADAFKILCSAFVKTINLALDVWGSLSLFHDFVDIVVGWLVDEDQFESGMYKFCADVIQRLDKYFSLDSTFTVNLLGQVLDDLEESVQVVRTSKGADSLTRTALLIKAFTTIFTAPGQICGSNPEYSSRFTSSVIKVVTWLKISEEEIGISNLLAAKLLILQETFEFLSRSGNCDKPSSRIFIKKLLSKSDLSSCSKFTAYPNLSDFFSVLHAWILLIIKYSELDTESMEMLDGVLLLLSKELTHTRDRDPTYAIECVHSLLKSQNLAVLQKVYTWLVRMCTTMDNLADLIPETSVVQTVLVCISNLAVSRKNLMLTRYKLDPTLLRFLVFVSSKARDSNVKFAALHVLKAHCLAHSHFVSSLFSAAQSQNSQLQTLTDFWLVQLDSAAAVSSVELVLWVLDWILVFMKTTSTYASLLIEFFSGFYVKLLEIMLEGKCYHSTLIAVLDFIIGDPDYCKTELYPLARDMLLKFLEKCEHKDLKAKAMRTLNGLRELVVTSRQTLASFNEEADPTEISLSSRSSTPDILIDNQFFDQLMGSLASAADVAVTYTCSEVQEAVTVLIRNKLKSSLGKPSDLFAAMQNLLRSYSCSNGSSFPMWKLHFMFLLDRDINIAMQETILNAASLSENVRNFYITNKVPCSEWLKRLRQDLQQVGVKFGSYEHALLLTNSTRNDNIAKLASYYLQDTDTLKSMNEEFVYHWMMGSYEEAIRLSDRGAKISETSVDQLHDSVYSQVEHWASNSLSEWPSDGISDSKLLFEAVKVENQFSVPKNILKPCDLVALYDPDNLSALTRKSHLILLDQDGDKLKPSSLCALKKWVQANEINLNETIRNDFTLLEVKALLREKNGTLTWKLLENLATTQVNLSSMSPTRFTYLKAQADCLYLMGDCKTAAGIYGSLYEKTKSIEALATSQLLEFATDLLSKSRMSEAFCQELDAQYGSKEESFSKSGLPISLQIFEKFLDIDQLNQSASLWLDYGDFMYDASRVPDSSLKKKSVEAYATAIVLSSKSSSAAVRKRKNEKNLVQGMVRLIELINDSNVPLELAEHCFSSSEWLRILHGLVNVERLHKIIYKRFPRESSLIIASQQSVAKCTITVKDRTSIFDPRAYGFHEKPAEAECVNQNPVDHNVNQPNRQEGPGNTSEVELPVEIRFFYKEMKRIGTSKEDQWLSAFQKLHFDWQKRISSLRDDAAKDNTIELFQSYTKPVWIFCEELLNSAEQEDVSPADLMFLSKYKATILQVISGIRSSRSVSELMNAYNQLGKMINSFSANMESKVPIANLSPYLSKFDFKSSATRITVPGIPTNVDIVGLESHAQILATKTKPKKIAFRGSNGKLYMFLLKGNENLNVDCCVMQFMKLVEAYVKWPGRTYFVTPLGKKGGLIQLVPDTVPVFHLYKKYLQRKGVEERTTDLFWQRIYDAGEYDRSNSEVVRQVFDKLSSETSPYLISRELQAAAKSAKAWYSSVETFTKDCVLASAIGYVLGIGDRHLDNILINETTGYLIHVDFSLVFGKGLRLRVPERVPFRLTQNFATALKYPGISGSFQVLLETFILGMKNYDNVVTYGVSQIANACVIPEDLPCCPLRILEAELNSAITILESRHSRIIQPGAILKLDIQEIGKEIQETTEEINVLNRKMLELSEGIESLTAIMGTLGDQSLDARSLQDLKLECTFISAKKAWYDRLKKLENFLVSQITDYQITLEKRKELVQDTKHYRNVLQNIKSVVETGTSTSELYHVSTLLEEIVEVADVAMALSWVFEELPYETHCMVRTYEAIQSFDVMGQETTVLPTLESIHTPETAFRVWQKLNSNVSNLQQDIAIFGATENDGVKVRNELEVLAGQTRALKSKIAVKYTNSEWPIVDQQILQYLTTMLKSSNFCFGAAVALMEVYTFLGHRDLPQLADVRHQGGLEGLESKSKEYLQDIVRGNLQELEHLCIQTSLNAVKSLQRAFKIGNEVNVFDHILKDIWNTALLNFKYVEETYRRWFTGGVKPEWMQTESVTDMLVSPVRSFVDGVMIVLGDLALKAIGELLDPLMEVELAESTAGCNSIIELYSRESRIQQLKNNVDLARQRETSLLFLKHEKQKFEYGFQWELTSHPEFNRAMNNSKTTLPNALSLLHTIEFRLLELQDETDMSTYLKSFGNENPEGYVAELYKYINSVHRFAANVTTFHSSSRNSSILKQYQKLNDTQAELLESKKQLVTSVLPAGSSLTLEVAAIEKAGKEIMEWRSGMEKLVVAKLQSEIASKAKITESLVKSSKKNKNLIGRLTRVIQRWGRVLSSLHPTLKFIHDYAKDTEDIPDFRITFKEEWLKNVASYWLTKPQEEILENPTSVYKKFDESERILKKLVEHLSRTTGVAVSPTVTGIFPPPISQQPDVYLSFTQQRIGQFEPEKSVKQIIKEAVSKDTLAQMYEGWSAWV